MQGDDFMRYVYKKWIYIACAMMCICGISALACAQRQKAQEEISDYVLRLHIRADSDRDADQAKKIKVRDAFLKSLASYQDEMTSKACTEAVIDTHGEDILEHMMQMPEMEDISDQIHVTLGTEWFPERSYGDITLPKGMYEAVIVDIGSGMGKNWWCVIFPKLCFINPVSGYIPEDAKTALKEKVSENTWQIVDEPEVEAKLKIVEILEQVFMVK